MDSAFPGTAVDGSGNEEDFSASRALDVGVCADERNVYCPYIFMKANSNILDQDKPQDEGSADTGFEYVMSPERSSMVAECLSEIGVDDPPPCGQSSSVAIFSFSTLPSGMQTHPDFYRPACAAEGMEGYKGLPSMIGLPDRKKSPSDWSMVLGERYDELGANFSSEMIKEWVGFQYTQGGRKLQKIRRGVLLIIAHMEHAGIIQLMDVSTGTYSGYFGKSGFKIVDRQKFFHTMGMGLESTLFDTQLFAKRFSTLGIRTATDRRRYKNAFSSVVFYSPQKRLGLCTEFSFQNPVQCPLNTEEEWWSGH